MTDAEPMKIEVLLAYESLPSIDKKGRMVLRSKFKNKKKGKGGKPKAGKPAKGGKSTKSVKGKNKKKRGKKKKSSVEVTTNHEDVLEDPEELDEGYKALRAKVMQKLKDDDMVSAVTTVDRSVKLEAKIESILATDCDTFYLVDLTTVVLK